VADIAEEEHQQPGGRKSSDEKYKGGKKDSSDQWLSTPHDVRPDVITESTVTTAAAGRLDLNRFSTTSPTRVFRRTPIKIQTQVQVRDYRNEQNTWILVVRRATTVTFPGGVGEHGLALPATLADTV
jgi:hypothetical protein